MVMAGMGGVLIGFLLIAVAAVTKKEKWQMAYGVIGLIFIFWSLGYLGFGPFMTSVLPALTLLFALFTFYTKGSTQLISMFMTILLLFQLTI